MIHPILIPNHFSYVNHQKIMKKMLTSIIILIHSMLSLSVHHKLFPIIFHWIPVKSMKFCFHMNFFNFLMPHLFYLLMMVVTVVVVVVIWLQVDLPITIMVLLVVMIIQFLFRLLNIFLEYLLFTILFVMFLPCSISSEFVQASIIHLFFNVPQDLWYLLISSMDILPSLTKMLWRNHYSSHLINLPMLPSSITLPTLITFILGDIEFIPNLFLLWPFLDFKIQINIYKKSIPLKFKFT